MTEDVRTCGLQRGPASDTLYSIRLLIRLIPTDVFRSWDSLSLALGIDT